MKRSIRVSAVLLFAMLFQSVALAMPCCFDMDRTSGEALTRLVLKLQHEADMAAIGAAEGDHPVHGSLSVHCNHHEQVGPLQTAGIYHDASDSHADGQMPHAPDSDALMKCPMMGFLPTFQPGSPADSKLTLAVPMGEVKQSSALWSPHQGFSTPIERPPRSI